MQLHNNILFFKIMHLQTQRLRIIPLTQAQLANYSIPDFSLENSLNVNTITRIVPEFLANVINNKILPSVNDTSKNPLYYTFWTIIFKQENVMVADLCFKGEPNDNGEIEIGYGTYPTFEGKGFMTEAVGEIIKWAFAQPKVQSVTAQTDPTNIASQKILEKNNFMQYGKTVENILWRIDK
jgi:[ribosomal protein S5]-alanine N-acetyltransferase